MTTRPEPWWIVAIPVGFASSALTLRVVPRLMRTIFRFFSGGAYRLLSILLFGVAATLLTTIGCYFYLKNLQESYIPLYFALACCALSLWVTGRYALEIRKGTWKRIWEQSMGEMQKAAVLPQMTSISEEDFRFRVKAVRRRVLILGCSVALLVLLLPIALVSSHTLRTITGVSADIAGLTMLVSLVAIPVFVLVCIRNVCWHCGVFCPNCGPQKVHINFINYVLAHGTCPKCKCRILALPGPGAGNKYN